MKAPGTGFPSESTTRPAIVALPPPIGRVVVVGLPVTAIGCSDTRVRSTGSVLVVVSPVFGAGSALPSCLEHPANSGRNSTRPAAATDVRTPGARGCPPEILRPLPQRGGHGRRLAPVPADDDVG